MSGMSPVQLEEHQQACDALLKSKKSALMATLSAAGVPESSYAPYIRDDKGCFYIFVSELAAHTQNLLANPVCSLFFIEDESSARNLFARERLSFRCRVGQIARDAAEYELMLDQMEAEHGNTVGLLRGLGDFRLFALMPEEGSYVVGFGKAFEVNPSDGSLIHLDEARVKASG